MSRHVFDITSPEIQANVSIDVATSTLRPVWALEADLMMRFEAVNGLLAGAIEASPALQRKWAKSWKSFLKLCAENAVAPAS